jgi:hypothetical protein
VRNAFRFSMGVWGTRSQPGQTASAPASFALLTDSVISAGSPCLNVFTGSRFPNSMVPLKTERDKSRSLVWSTETASAPVSPSSPTDRFVFPHTERTVGLPKRDITCWTDGKTNSSNLAGPMNAGDPPISWMVIRSAPASRYAEPHWERNEESWKSASRTEFGSRFISANKIQE